MPDMRTAQQMDYEYDVFVSYTDDFFGQWLHQHFLPIFEPFLGNALSRPTKIFYDKGKILSGDAWPERLKRSLALSRCLVGIWSPIYFQRTYCMYECIVMLHREKQLGYRTLENPSGLVLPVTVFDGENFPEFAKAIQRSDYTRFARVGEGFARTERYVEFQDITINWVQEVAEAIRKAPPFREEWLKPEWLDGAINSWPDETIKQPNSMFKQPILA